MVEYKQNQRERKSEAMTQSRDFLVGRTSGTAADEDGFLMWRPYSLFSGSAMSCLKIKNSALISRLFCLSARRSSPLLKTPVLFSTIPRFVRLVTRTETPTYLNLETESKAQGLDRRDRINAECFVADRNPSARFS